MKKYIRVILIAVAILLLFVVYYGYQVYQMIMGSEELSGRKEAIPSLVAERTQLITGESDWPNWRGSNFDGRSQVKGIATDWTNGLQKRWQIDYLCQDQESATWSAPVVQGNRLIIPGRDEENDLLFCINTDNGKPLWVGSYPAEAQPSHGQGSRATPFIDSDRVYTFGRSGDIACWAMLDGKLLWRKNVKNEGGVEPRWGYSTTPLVLGSKVIVQGGGKALVLAYDKYTGSVVWKSGEGEAGYSASVPIQIQGDTMILVYTATALSCFDPTNGTELWSAPWVTDYGVNATTPTVEGDIVFHSSGYKMGAQALRVSRQGYTVLWKNPKFSAQHTDPLIIDGYIYGYSGESSSMKGLFMCLDLKTGNEMWSTNRIGQGTVTFVDGHIVSLDIKGNLYMVKPDPKEFRLVGEIRNAVEDVKKQAWTVPVVANGRLYLRYLQRLVCYDLVSK